MRMNHVTLHVTDFERSKQFYRLLGFEQIVDAPPRYARFICPAGDATLSIEVTPDAAPVAAPNATIFFECDDLDGTVSALKARGVKFDLDPTDMPYLWREAHLRDPDGHALRLFHAGENRLDPPWRIGNAAPSA